MHRNKSTRLAIAVAAVLPALGLVSSTAQAVDLYWDGDAAGPQAGGPGTWNTTSVHFSTTAGGTVDQIWNNANIDSAVFDVGGGTSSVLKSLVNLAGGITVNTINVGVPFYEFGNGNGIGGAANTLTFSGTNPGFNLTHTSGTTFSTAVLAGIVTKSGTGRLELNNSANPSTSKYIVTNGSLTAPNINRFGAAPGALVSDFLTLNGGGLGFNTTTTGIDFGATRGITIGASGGFFAASANTVQVTLSGPIVAAPATTGDVNFGGSAATFIGSGHLSTGIWTLSNTGNAWAGNLNMVGPSGSRVLLGASGVIPDTSAVNTNVAGTTFELNGFDETIKALGGTAGTAALGVRTLTLNNPTGENYLSVLTGTAGAKLVKNGAGVQIFSGSSTGYAGEVVLNSGTIGINSNNGFGAAVGAKLSINGGVLSNFSASGRTLSANLSVDINVDVNADDSLAATQGQMLFAGPSTLKNGDRTFTISGTTTNLGFSGAMGEDVAGRSITKMGTGILALNSALNTYTGTTTITQGQINVDGDGRLGDGMGTLILNGGNLNSSATRTASSDPIGNPINVAVSSAITTSSNAATVDLNLSNDSISGAGGVTLTLQNNGTGGFQPRFTGAGVNFNPPAIALNNGTGTTRLSSFNPALTTQTFNNVISGTGSYRRTASTVTNGGDSIFNAANTYSGGASITEGGIGFGVSSTGSDGPIGTGTLTISPFGDTGTPRLFASGGARNVSNPMIWSSANLGALTFSGTEDLTMSGTLDLGGATRSISATNTGATELSGIISNGGITKEGVETLTLSNTNTYSGGNTVNAGTLVSTMGFKGNGPMAVNAGSAVVPEGLPNTYDPGLGQYPSGDNAKGSKVSSLTIANNGDPLGTRVYTATLDLGNSDMAVDYVDPASPLDDIRDMLRAGYNFGGWDGTGIISNTVNVNNPNQLDPSIFGLGYAENGALPVPYGNLEAQGGPLFSDQDVDLSTVLIKFTWVGDLNLDGFVDFQDLSVFNTNYDNGATSGRYWFEGDFNYDGFIDFGDLSLFNTNYDPSKPSLPEPSGLAALGLAALGTVARRRRKRQA